ARDIVNMCKKIMEEYNGQVPDSIEELTKLPGVGRKTANLVVGDIFGKPAVVCDTHCIRITNLLGLTTTKDPGKCEKELRPILPPEKSNDFCHRLVLHGRAVCKARRPDCAGCCMQEFCDYALSRLQTAGEA
ncbi:MAG: endonuclease III domain-containing protein, partial [Oscillospiraceae bacterium]